MMWQHFNGYEQKDFLKNDDLQVHIKIFLF
jgi:hypothetical protein